MAKMKTAPVDPLPLELGARADYVLRIATRQAEALADGMTLTVDLAGGALKLRRAGEGFALSAPGMAARSVVAADLPAILWAGMLTHASVRAADLQAMSENVRS